MGTFAQARGARRPGRAGRRARRHRPLRSTRAAGPHQRASPRSRTATVRRCATKSRRGMRAACRRQQTSRRPRRGRTPIAVRSRCSRPRGRARRSSGRPSVGWTTPSVTATSCARARRWTRTPAGGRRGEPASALAPRSDARPGRCRGGAQRAHAFAHQRGPAVDEPGVELHQRRARRKLFLRIGAALDAADADDRQRAVERLRAGRSLAWARVAPRALPREGPLRAARPARFSCVWQVFCFVYSAILC